MNLLINANLGIFSFDSYKSLEGIIAYFQLLLLCD